MSESVLFAQVLLIVVPLLTGLPATSVNVPLPFLDKASLQNEKAPEC
jgi:hypothetical protein